MNVVQPTHNSELLFEKNVRGGIFFFISLFTTAELNESEILSTSIQSMIKYFYAAVNILADIFEVLTDSTWS